MELHPILTVRYLMSRIVVLFLTILLQMSCSGILSLSTNMFEQKKYSDTFSIWSDLANGRWISPAYDLISDYDLKYNWIGPDKHEIKLVVRQPDDLIEKNRVYIGEISEFEDARSYFEKAVEIARLKNANILSISPGTYNFLSIEDKFNAHFVLENLHDFIIEGNGAILNFSKNSAGILIQDSQRLRIDNLTLNFKCPTTSIGTIIKKADGNALLIGSDYTTDKDVKIYQMAEIDSQNHFIPGGVRIILPRDVAQPTYMGDHLYLHKLFEGSTMEGKRFFVIHTWYGGQAIKIDGHRNINQTEDITVNNVNIKSTPGMGLTVTGLKRGLAVINSKFGTEQSNFIRGIGWDGIHVTVGGGDILISNNRFSFLGDDAINLNYPIHPLVKYDFNAKHIIASNSSQYISMGDGVAFFDRDGVYEGKSTVIENPKLISQNNYELQLDSIPTGIDDSSFVRDIDLISSRFLISDNLVENTNGHGLLAQIPNGLVTNNTFNYLRANAIRVLSSIGKWNEGVGGFNIAIRNNYVKDGGEDNLVDFPWSAISVYGLTKFGNTQKYLFNENIEITDNKLTGLRQGCITLSSTQGGIVSNNTCNYLSSNYRSEDITVINSEDINLQ